MMRKFIVGCIMFVAVFLGGIHSEASEILTASAKPGELTISAGGDSFFTYGSITVNTIHIYDQEGNAIDEMSGLALSKQVGFNLFGLKSLIFKIPSLDVKSPNTAKAEIEINVVRGIKTIWYSPLVTKSFGSESGKYTIDITK